MCDEGSFPSKGVKFKYLDSIITAQQKGTKATHIRGAIKKGFDDAKQDGNGKHTHANKGRTREAQDVSFESHDNNPFCAFERDWQKPFWPNLANRLTECVCGPNGTKPGHRCSQP